MSEEATQTSGLRLVWEWIKTVAVAFVFFLLVHTLLMEAFQIPTASMENTLLVGDFLLVNKAAYGAEIPGTGWQLPALDRPERGDVVVFEPPAAAGQPPETRYVKRIVGVPGDTLRMAEGVLHRNGRAVEEPYAKHGRTYADPYSERFLWQRSHLAGGPASVGRYRPTRDNWGPVVVPSDSFFVMGDNRDNSEDSRYWGFVGSDAIEGRPFVVYYSYRRQGALPLSWVTQIRWNRILTPIR